MIKANKHHVTLLLLYLFFSLSAGAQQPGRWMVGLSGSLPLGQRAPFYTAGLEVSYYALRSGNFQFGPGVGLLAGTWLFSYAETRQNNYQNDGHQLRVPFFLRGEYQLWLGAVRAFAMLDIGGQIQILPSYDGRRNPTDVTTNGGKIIYAFSETLVFYFAQTVGIDLGRHCYLAAGIQGEQLRYHFGAPRSAFSTSAVLKFGARF